MAKGGRRTGSGPKNKKDLSVLNPKQFSEHLRSLDDASGKERNEVLALVRDRVGPHRKWWQEALDSDQAREALYNCIFVRDPLNDKIEVIQTPFARDLLLTLMKSTFPAMQDIPLDLSKNHPPVNILNLGIRIG
jgi:hypothetical protein